MDSGEWNEAYQDDATAQALDPLLVSEVAALAPGAALDLGCGAGTNAVHLAELGWDVTGIDFAPDAIRIANKLAADRGVHAEFVVGDTTTWEPPSLYDLVIIMYALPGGENSAKTLATGLEALAPGGTLLAIDFARDSIEEGGQSFFEPDELTTTDEIIAALPGLEVERAENVDVQHHYEAEEASMAEGNTPGHGDAHAHEGHGHDDHAAWPKGAFVRAKKPT